MEGFGGLADSLVYKVYGFFMPGTMDGFRGQNLLVTSPNLPHYDTCIPINKRMLKIRFPQELPLVSSKLHSLAQSSLWMVLLPHYALVIPVGLGGVV